MLEVLCSQHQETAKKQYYPALTNSPL